MSEKDDNMLIADTIKDAAVRKFLYLDKTLFSLIDELSTIKFSDIGDDALVPFNAKIRGYTGARDEEGNEWLLKEIPKKEAREHKIQEIAYYFDFVMKTPAAPTIVYQKDGKTFRATKHISSAMQISSYNYLENPFLKMIANDLINRWLFFDEDRNPNNYLVKHDSDTNPYIIVIDYNKADLETPGMKISGTDDKFGWHREEKTRFLTLLKPENFQKLSIGDFEQRLQIMMQHDDDWIRSFCRKVFSSSVIPQADVQSLSEEISQNLIERRNYLNTYFRKWFQTRNLEAEKEIDDRYAGLGQSFLDYYKRKT